MNYVIFKSHSNGLFFTCGLFHNTLSFCLGYIHIIEIYFLGLLLLQTSLIPHADGVGYIHCCLV